jgi:hypothetical protein
MALPFLSRPFTLTLAVADEPGGHFCRPVVWRP